VIELASGVKQTIGDINEKGVILSDIDDSRIKKSCNSYMLHLKDETSHPYDSEKLVAYYTGVCNTGLENSENIDLAFERPNDQSPRYSYTVYSRDGGSNVTYVKFSPDMEDAARHSYDEFRNLLQADLNRVEKHFESYLNKTMAREKLKQRWFKRVEG
jgi:hypothetical protein